jgi:hypothetical protein
MPRSVVIGLGSGFLLLAVFALAGSLDLLACAAVTSYLAVYGFSRLLLRPPGEWEPDPPEPGSEELSPEDGSP